MTIFSSFSANFPPHYHTILAINCVHASNWCTHLQQTQQTDVQSDNSVFTVLELAEASIYIYIGNAAYVGCLPLLYTKQGSKCGLMERASC